MEFDALATALAIIKKDWSVLSSRIHTAEHDIVTNHKHLNLRLHYPALRDAQATVEELVRTIALYLTHFSLPRKQVEAIYATQETMKTAFERHQAISRLEQEARSLFIRARKSSQRTGEAGELLLYLLTEWLLDAPQIIAKMSLKTNAQMPVYGFDGIHVRFDAKTNRLVLFSGEAKLHSDITKAIASAVTSIKTGLSREKMQHEIELVQRHIDFSGLDETARTALLRYLDPFDEAYNNRLEVVTCLIGFDFTGYARLSPDELEDLDTNFKTSATAKLREVGPIFAKALTDAGLANQRVELFLFPVPSVSVLRDLFQNQIGWTRD
ncbi:hypothetical protein Nham_1151 [Nitrobacter hamburgensis X14]|uniref:Anti-bacteriophage protein A/HamA C-terminal domain-containing protein n=1 Tax=Nitrobacter hamburgensis (strain DSM 10229 / NCIMB 13809 / X14) TaxID=323097 RepID=Q1QP51_NITHX|nr:DUF1837 domain-containing protein [Nitrobacter hamburgensis]ABE61996.1 hypothetical protein Nham_1151 [Nitrobacter hamburgensis X14]